MGVATVARYAARQLGRLGYGDFRGAEGLGLNFSDILRGVLPIATGIIGSEFDTGGVLPDGQMGPPAPSDWGDWVGIANRTTQQLLNVLGPGGPSGPNTAGPSRPGAPLPSQPLFPPAAPPRAPVAPPGRGVVQGPPSRPGAGATAGKAGAGIGVAVVLGLGVFLLMGRKR